MNRKTKIIILGGTASLALLVSFSVPHIGQEAAPSPTGCPVSTVSQVGKVMSPPEPPSDLVSEKTAESDALPILSTEIEPEPPKSNDSLTNLTPKDAPMDNTTPTPTPSQNTDGSTATEPKMGDTRTVDGQNQVYFLGFGWIEDNDMPNECIYAEDMFENGNKIGEMGGGTFVDGEGDINKMVGIMD